MSEKTWERIRTVIEMTNYRPSDIASNLKKRTTNLIGLLIADISSPFSSALREGQTFSQAVRRGCAVGAIQVMSRGDNDGLPSRAELDAFMAGQKDWRRQSA